ncbi:hypothetical protein AB4Z22_29165, partial [Paenibacillus sp. TAF58]
MRNIRYVQIIILVCIISLITAACSGKDSTDKGKTAGVSLLSGNWDQVLAEAKGQTVNWYMWGGS